MATIGIDVIDVRTPLDWTDSGAVLWRIPLSMMPVLPDTLDHRGVRLHRKQEFHITVLGRKDGRVMFGERHRNSIFGRWQHAWSELDRSVTLLDELWLLQKTNHARTSEHTIAVACRAPALAAARLLVSSWAGVELPQAPAHVTLFYENDPHGIAVGNPAELVDRCVETGTWASFGLTRKRAK